MSANDVLAIRELLAAQFHALCWRSGDTPDFSLVLNGFLDGALLYPAKRPAVPQTALAFCERLDSLRQSGPLANFRERPLGITVEVFGNIAVAMAGCEMTENDTTVTRDVSGFLLIKDNNAWRIAAQGWDVESADLAIPAKFLTPEPPKED